MSSLAPKSRNVVASKILHQLRCYQKNWILVLMLLPGILYFIVFKYIPIYGIQIAFKDFNLTKGIIGSEWVGLKYFKILFALGSFKEVLRNTLIISSLQLVIGFPVPIILALMINELSSNAYKRTIQTISYLPHFVSWVVLAGILMPFLSPSTGPINIALKALGFRGIYFLGDNRWFRFVLIFTEIWKSAGWGSIIYLAALSNIDPTLYEAAIIDGANRMQRILYITIPSLSSVITIMLIFAIGRIINDNFDQVFNLYSPIVYPTGDVLSTYLYRMGLEKMQFSLATAVGLFRNIISFSLVIIANFSSKKINNYGIW